MARYFTPAPRMLDPVWAKVQLPIRLGAIRESRRALAIIGVMVLVAAVVGAVILGPVFVGPDGPKTHTYQVTFTISGDEQELAAGSLPYDAYAVHRLNVSDPQLTRVTARLEWEDNGKTPTQDPYVNLILDYQGEADLWGGDEIQAPGGSIFVEIPNPIPENATVMAEDGGAAVETAIATVNNTTAGVGEWWVRVTTQSPGDIRPFVGGEIYYRVWVTLEFYEGEATLAP